MSNKFSLASCKLHPNPAMHFEAKYLWPKDERPTLGVELGVGAGGVGGRGCYAEFSRAKQHEEAPPQGCQASPGNGNYYSILGLYRIKEKKTETTIVCWFKA